MTEPAPTGCHVDTCGESTPTGQPRPATVWVAQGIEPRGVRLVAVCEVHADGWYDGSDGWLPRIFHKLPRTAGLEAPR